MCSTGLPCLYSLTRTHTFSCSHPIRIRLSPYLFLSYVLWWVSLSACLSIVLPVWPQFLNLVCRSLGANRSRYEYQGNVTLFFSSFVIRKAAASFKTRLSFVKETQLQAHLPSPPHAHTLIKALTKNHSSFLAHRYISDTRILKKWGKRGGKVHRESLPLKMKESSGSMYPGCLLYMLCGLCGLPSTPSLLPPLLYQTRVVWLEDSSLVHCFSRANPVYLCQTWQIKSLTCM